MKKLLILTLALCMICVPALAEDAARVDVTYPVILALLFILAVCAAAAKYVWAKWIRPWLQDHNMLEFAEAVVYAVEKQIGRGFGSEKWKLSLEKMKEYGFDVDSQAVIDALNAAWKKLDLSQMMAGEKTPEKNEGGDTDA